MSRDLKFLSLIWKMRNMAESLPDEELKEVIQYLESQEDPGASLEVVKNEALKRKYRTELEKKGKDDLISVLLSEPQGLNENEISIRDGVAIDLLYNKHQISNDEMDEIINQM